MFESNWQGVVVSIERHPVLSATHVITLENGRKINICPTQDVLVYSKIGDSLVKQTNMFFCRQYRNGVFLRELRLTSETCDSIVLIKSIR